MVIVEKVEYPSQYLECLESVLVTILNYMGWSDTPALMGTQAYFRFDPDNWDVRSRYNRIYEEWNRIYGITLENSAISSEAQLNEQILAKLTERIPVCLPLDVYWLPYTPHYQRLYQLHFVNIFGYKDDSYYVVCPYYQFTGWVELEHIYTSFFSRSGGFSRRVLWLPFKKYSPLSSEKVRQLIIESCQSMIGLTIPNPLTEIQPQYLGLEGIKTFSAQFINAISCDKSNISPTHLTNLSRHLLSVGNSRYWLHELLKQNSHLLLTSEVVDSFQKQFETVFRAWRGLGRTLGMLIHAEKSGTGSKKHEAISKHLEKLYSGECSLFYNLLDALGECETGVL